MKELDFSLKEVQQLLSGAKSDRAAAFCRKKHQFLIERGHLDRQIELLTRLEERDTIDNLQEYDLSEYFRALEEFKTSHKDEVITYWGSEENFDLFIQQIRKSEAQAARLAVQEFGSVEAYTEAMKYNLEHFSEIMKKWQAQIPEELKAEDPFVKLASHKGEPVSSDAVQQLVRDAISRARDTASSELFCDHASYCDLIIELYSGDYIQAVTDTKHGTGSAEYIVSAFQYYLDHFRERG